MEYSEENLNFFRMCHVCFTLIPQGLRQIFRREWDFRYKTTSFGEWQDTPQNGHDFCSNEMTRKAGWHAYVEKIRNGNTAEWDTSCLCFAILYSDSVGTTLSPIVRAAVDDLRRVKNHISHVSDGKMADFEFQMLMGRVSNAFSTLGLSIVQIEDARNQTNVPTKDVHLRPLIPSLNKLNRELVGVRVSIRKEELGLKLESFCSIPLKPSHEVIRRVADVERISNNMHEVYLAASDVVSTIYLSGRPGCGKSQLARQLGGEFFSKRSDNAEDMAFVATLNAESVATLHESYVTVARYLRIPEYTLVFQETHKELTLSEKFQRLQHLILPKVRQYSNWLIIADNVLDFTSVGKFLPQTGSKEWGHGQVLVLTQDVSAVHHNAPNTHHESLNSGMQPEDALTLLEKVSQDFDRSQATNVAKVLDYQPLALAYAASYVQTKVNSGNPSYSWTEYLEELTHMRQQEVTENVLRMALQRTLETDEVLRNTFILFRLRASKLLPLSTVVEFVKSRIPDQREESIKSTILRSAFVLNGENEEQTPCLGLHNLVYASLERDVISVPSEIRARGAQAQLAYINALKHGKVKVHRARIMLIGQDRAGKTSLKKSFLGQPFKPSELSTDGITVDPSKFEIDIDQVTNWQQTGNKLGVSQFASDLANMVADKLEKEQALLENDDGQVMILQQSLENLSLSMSANDLANMMDEQVEEGKANVGVQDKPMKGPKREEIAPSIGMVQEENTGSEFAILDRVLPPEEFTECLVQRLSGLSLQSEAASGGNYMTLDLWDFAGQHLYYSSYPVFLSPRAVYMLVYNMSKELNNPAEPRVRVGNVDSHLENPNGETNLDNLLSWLVTVVTMCSGQPTANHLCPPVFIVGTHADEPCQNIKEMESQIEMALYGNDLDHHVIREGVNQNYFSVDNTLGSSCSGVRTLQKKMIEVLKQESYMGEERPVRWFLFEKVIQALVTELKMYSLNFKQLNVVIQRFCLIDDELEVDAMLNFYHDLGVIVRHRSTVVLQAQWLIDLFRQLITIRSYKGMESRYSSLWKDLEDKGVLSMELVDHVFSKFVQQGVFRKDILNMMEQFGLIVRFQYSPDDAQYFVPSLLKTPPDPLCYQEPSSADPCALYISFLGGFVPHGLYSQLVSRCTKWCSDRGVEYAPNFFDGASRFVVEKEFLHQLTLLCKKKFIKIILKLRESPDKHKGMEDETARLVLGFLQDALKNMTGDSPWLSNLNYKFCVECPYCPKKKYPCRKHSKVSCNHEDCICLLTLPVRAQAVYCQDSFFHETLMPLNLDKWFPVKGKKMLVPSSSKRGSARCISQQFKKRKGESSHAGKKMPVCASSKPGSSGYTALRGSKRRGDHVSAEPPSYTSQQCKKRKPEHAGAVKEGNPSYYELEGLSQKIVHWRSLGRRLNFHEAQLHGFDNENSQWREKAYAMLRKWKERDGPDATYQVLYEVLCHEYVQRKDLAQKFCCHVEGK